MRIAMLSWEARNAVWSGGVGVHVSDLSGALTSLGQEVHLVTRRAPGQAPHEIIGGVHYHRCDYPTFSDLFDDINSMCRQFADQVFRLESLVGPFDVIHSHDWLTANALIWIKRNRNRIGVLTTHSTEYARRGNATPNNSASSRTRHLEGSGTKCADLIIAVSGAVAREIGWMYRAPESKIRVIYNGVYSDRFVVGEDSASLKSRYGIREATPTILYCGRMAYHKGPDLLLEAIPEMLRFYRKARFVFVGEGEMKADLERRTNELGIEAAVLFLGHRDSSELPQLFGMADAVCVPSRNEPFGIVVLEAWSASKPVLTTNVGGPAEYVEHNETGLHIAPNPASIGWGLGTLFMDWNKAQRMGRKGRVVAETRFSWDAIARQTLAAYASIDGEQKSTGSRSFGRLAAEAVASDIALLSSASER